MAPSMSRFACLRFRRTPSGATKPKWMGPIVSRNSRANPQKIGGDFKDQLGVCGLEVSSSVEKRRKTLRNARQFR
jgi:hypothetical protein